MEHLNKNAVLQDMNLQEIKDINGGIGAWMYIDPLISVLALELLNDIK